MILKGTKFIITFCASVQNVYLPNQEINLITKVFPSGMVKKVEQRNKQTSKFFLNSEQ